MSPTDARLLDAAANDLTEEIRRRLADQDPSDPDSIRRQVRAAVHDVVGPILTLPLPTATVSSAAQLTLPPPITVPIPEQLALQLA